MFDANLIASVAICCAAGLLLAVVELVKTFGRWMGAYWLNRYVLLVIGLNMLTAVIVFAILHFILAIQNTFWLAITTGITFPAILRSRFVFYRPVGKESTDSDSVAIQIDEWYRHLQNLCYDEVNSRIAADRAQKVKQLRDTLTPARMIELLSDHIEAEIKTDSRDLHRQQLVDAQALADAKTRERRLATLMMDIMPEARINALLKESKQP